MNTYTTIYNDDRIAIIRLDNGDVRVDRRDFILGTLDLDYNAPIRTVTIPRLIARHIDFTDISNIGSDLTY